MGRITRPIERPITGLSRRRRRVFNRSACVMRILSWFPDIIFNHVVRFKRLYCYIIQCEITFLQNTFRRTCVEEIENPGSVETLSNDPCVHNVVLANDHWFTSRDECILFLFIFFLIDFIKLATPYVWIIRNTRVRDSV